jgi:hypothetical protein
MQIQTNSKTYKHNITCNDNKNKKTKFNDQITENRKFQGYKKKIVIHGEVIMQMFLHE